MPLPKFNIGDIVTTTQSVEALYSGFYPGTPSAWPVQAFAPGMRGVVAAVDSPAVRRNVLQYVVDFEGVPYSKHKHTNWRVRLDPEFVVPVLVAGQQVRHPLYGYVGTVLKFDEEKLRAFIQWSDNRTWMKIQRLRLAIS